MQWFVVVYDRETRKAIAFDEFPDSEDAKAMEAYGGYLKQYQGARYDVQVGAAESRGKFLKGHPRFCGVAVKVSPESKGAPDEAYREPESNDKEISLD